MKRRDAIRALVALMAASPVMSRAQHPARRVGVIHQGGPFEAAVDGLRETLAQSSDRDHGLVVENAKGDLPELKLLRARWSVMGSP